LISAEGSDSTLNLATRLGRWPSRRQHLPICRKFTRRRREEEEEEEEVEK